MEETTTGFTRQNSYTLALLTLSFIIGEISHFLISVVNMEVARDLHYGDLSCYPHPNESLRSQSFTYLMEKFCQERNRFSSFSMCLYGTFLFLLKKSSLLS